MMDAQTVTGEKAVASLQFCTGQGQLDTPKGGAAPYATITGAEIVRMVKDPPNVAKERAQWFIPSSYAAHDARSHDAQRQNGAFWFLPLDVDENNLAMAEIEDALVTVLGDVVRMIYSTRSAKPDERKWRALIPLAEPVAGADYADTVAAFFDLLEQASGGVLIPDRALARPGQLVYLPNRGDYYDHKIIKAQRLDLAADHSVIIRREDTRRQRAEAEARARSWKAWKSQQAPTDTSSIVDAFNSASSVADLLTHYGYQRAGNSNDYRSPFQQSSGSYATRDFGDFWISLSASDAAQGIGRETKTGQRFGDAFDLFVHFEHGGDFAAAVRAYAVESGQDYRSKGSMNAYPPDKTDTTDKTPEPVPFVPDWPPPLARFLREARPPAPPLPLEPVLGPALAQWVREAAEAKGAPADYVFGALLTMAGATIGNARWVSPWKGWHEPPLIWAMAVGLPSAGKSPAFDAVLHPLREAEKPLRAAAEKAMAEWAEQAEVARIVEAAWRDAVRASLKEGKAAPERPAGADPGTAPVIPRLVLNDATIERVAHLLGQQPRGVLQFRDELSGWLLGMERYAGGGSDRPFWLEAYGGRGFTVERMGRPPLTVDRLTVGAMGGIQPDRLKTLLFKSDDDGLLARFVPIWPEPVPVQRPGAWADEALIARVIDRLLALKMATNEDDELRPWFVHFTEPARDLMDTFRLACREWEADAAGLLLSFIGKLPGLAARLSLVLALLDHAAEGAPEPVEIEAQHFGRAAHLVEAYILPMARRAYAEASVPADERAARAVVALIREQRWDTFTSRKVLRLERAGLDTARKLNPALTLLVEAEVLRSIENPPGPQGGRPQRLFAVNPAVHREAEA